MWKRVAWKGCVVAIIGALCTSVHAAEVAPKAVSVAAGELVDALESLAKQFGIDVIYPSGQIRGLKTQGVSGVLQARAAFEKLVEGTSLTVREQGNAVLITMPVDTTDAQSATSTRAPDRDAARIELEEVLVTGTNIRGVTNSSSPVLVYDRESIERTGYSTVGELMESIPQNFGGGANGASEDGLSGLGSARLTNFSAANGVNLRGLGNAATLVLVNGHRVAPSAFGAVVDTSMLPLGAVERIEIVMDGSSAIYGSDAIAGVVNIILRTDYEGAESRLRYGVTTDEGPDERIAAQSLGARWDEGSVLVGVQFRDRDALAADDRDFSAGRQFPAHLLPKLIQRNASLSLQQQFGATDLVADVLYGTKNVHRLFRQSTAFPGNATNSASNENLSATLGAGHDFAAGDWRLEGAFTYGTDETDHGVFARFPSLAHPQLSHLEYELKAADVKADGRLFDLPGGTVRVALGGSYREESFDQLSTTPASRVERGFSRDVKAVFGELHVPLVGPSNSVPAVRRLDLSLAGRHDDYSDFGSSTNPKFGVLWSPLSSLDVRATYSTSFRAPNINETFQTISRDSIFIQRPLSPTGPGTVPIFVLGGSDELGPEESENFTAGFTFSPQWVAGLRISANYSDVDYTDRIFQPGFLSTVLRNPDVFGSVITTFANDAEAQAFRDAEVANGAIFNAVGGTSIAGVRFAFNSRLRNVASLRQDGFDVTVDYDVEVGPNRFGASLNAGIINEIDVTIAPGASSTDIVDTFSNPLGNRYRADLHWSRGDFQANLALNYSGSYVDNVAAVRAPVDSWTTADLVVRYSPSGKGWLDGASITLVALNVLDEEPPFAVGTGQLTYGYDSANADPLGRVIALEVRKVW